MSEKSKDSEVTYFHRLILTQASVCFVSELFACFVRFPSRQLDPGGEINVFYNAPPALPEPAYLYSPGRLVLSVYI